MGENRTGRVVIDMPQDVRFIIATLENAGFEGYAVGGCVRDAVLNRIPQDWDITTSALPCDVKRLFKRTIDTGIEHGTVTVMLGTTGYEITTYRVDGEYEDMRHPKSVEFSKNLISDLKRRDFTINAMAYNDRVGLVDEYSGQDDLRCGVIRCVGNAKERFGEDALRMMRAIRFAAQLGFTIEEDTWNAIKELAHNIGRVSRERIAVELGKTLMSDRPQYVMLFSKCGIAGEVLKELDKAMKGAEKELALETAAVAEKNLPLRYASLMNYQGADAARSLLKGLKLDNFTIKTVTMLALTSSLKIEKDEYFVRKLLSKYGVQDLLLILQNQENILIAKELVTKAVCDKGRENIQKLRDMIAGVSARGDCFRICDLAIGGRELMALGYSGAAIGEKLNELLEMVLKDPKLNEPEKLMSFCK